MERKRQRNDKALVFERSKDSNGSPCERQVGDGPMALVEVFNGYNDRIRYVLRCPGCGARVHLCRMRSGAMYVAVDHGERHSPSCRNGRHKSKERLEKERKDRITRIGTHSERRMRNLREIDPDMGAFKGFRFPYMYAKSGAKTDDCDSSDKDSVKGDVRGLKRIRGNRSEEVPFSLAYRKPEGLRDLYIQFSKNRLDAMLPDGSGTVRQTIMCGKTKFAMRDLDGCFGRVVLIPAVPVPLATKRIVLASIQFCELLEEQGIQEGQYGLMYDCLKIPSKIAEDGSIVGDDSHRVILVLKFGSEDVGIEFENRFSRSDGRSKYIVGCHWSVEHDFVDSKGERRRFVIGVVSSIRKQIERIGEDDFSRFVEMSL